MILREVKFQQKERYFIQKSFKERTFNFKVFLRWFDIVNGVDFFFADKSEYKKFNEFEVLWAIHDSCIAIYEEDATRFILHPLAESADELWHMNEWGMKNLNIANVRKKK